MNLIVFFLSFHVTHFQIMENWGENGKVKANLHDSEILCDDISVNGPIKTGIATLRSSTCGSVGYTVAENIQQSLIGKSITRWPRRWQRPVSHGPSASDAHLKVPCKTSQTCSETSASMASEAAEAGLISAMTRLMMSKGHRQSLNLIALKLWICFGK